MNTHPSITSGSHAPALAYCLSLIPPGKLAIEFGAGPHSTPMFDIFANAGGFKVITYESDESYLDYAKSFRTKFHEVWKITHQTLPIILENLIKAKPHFVFLDNGWYHYTEDGVPKKYVPRNLILQELLPIVPLILCHDTEEGKSYSAQYGWDFSKAKYLKHFEDFGVRTTLASNSIDVSKLHYQSIEPPQ